MMLKLFFLISLREKCPNTEDFLVRILLYSDWTQENKDQKNLRIWTLFTQCKMCHSLKFEQNKDMNLEFLLSEQICFVYTLITVKINEDKI